MNPEFEDSNQDILDEEEHIQKRQQAAEQRRRSEVIKAPQQQQPPRTGFSPVFLEVAKILVIGAMKNCEFGAKASLHEYWCLIKLHESYGSYLNMTTPNQDSTESPQQLSQFETKHFRHRVDDAAQFAEGIAVEFFYQGSSRETFWKQSEGDRLKNLQKTNAFSLFNQYYSKNDPAHDVEYYNTCLQDAVNLMQCCALNEKLAVGWGPFTDKICYSKSVLIRFPLLIIKANSNINIYAKKPAPKAVQPTTRTRQVPTTPQELDSKPTGPYPTSKAVDAEADLKLAESFFELIDWSVTNYNAKAAPRLQILNWPSQFSEFTSEGGITRKEFVDEVRRLRNKLIGKTKIDSDTKRKSVSEVKANCAAHTAEVNSENHLLLNQNKQLQNQLQAQEEKIARQQRLADQGDKIFRQLNSGNKRQLSMNLFTGSKIKNNNSGGTQVLSPSFENIGGQNAVSFKTGDDEVLDDEDSDDGMNNNNNMMAMKANTKKKPVNIAEEDKHYDDYQKEQQMKRKAANEAFYTRKQSAPLPEEKTSYFGSMGVRAARTSAGSGGSEVQVVSVGSKSSNTANKISGKRRQRNEGGYNDDGLAESPFNVVLPETNQNNKTSTRRGTKLSNDGADSEDEEDLLLGLSSQTDAREFDDSGDDSGDDPGDDSRDTFGEGPEKAVEQIKAQRAALNVKLAAAKRKAKKVHDDKKSGKSGGTNKK